MPTDRANPASPWPDIRKESWLDRLRRGVQTARAYPLHERGANQGPLGVAINDLAASVPLPEDFAAMGDMAMRLMDPTGLYGNADAEGLEPIDALARPENLQAMLEYAGEHPVQTAASAFGGPAGIAAYRRFTPQNVRNLAHMFYGGGRPMHYVREELGSVPLRQRNPEMQTGSQAAAENTLRSAASRGADVPEWVKPEQYREYSDIPYNRIRRPDQRAAAEALELEWNTAFGKSFVTDRKRGVRPRVWDWYEFYPEAYGSANPEEFLRDVVRSAHVNDVYNTGAQMPGWVDFGARVRDLLEPINHRLAVAAARRVRDAERAVGAATHALPRYAAMKLGTPYAIDAALGGSSALYEGLAPFGAIGGAGEMLPVWARSAAPDSIRQLQR